ncbi:MAG: ADP-ribosylglycohydrolase family protein [Rhodospirillales bacterium]|nr:ADP-ribosylglycohydrolase family protein [Rhodospirillales bacterium]
MIGGAVGDAFGFEIEFDRLSEIRNRFGPCGITEPVFHRGHLIVSDDTQMTLFTLEGLLRCPPNRNVPDSVLHSVNEAYLDWYQTQQPNTSRPFAGALARDEILHVRRAPGITCLSALRNGGMGSPASPRNDSKGCGGVMRVAPVAFWSDIDQDNLFDLASRTAALTHGHPCGYLSAGAMATMIAGLIRGMTYDDVSERMLTLLEQEEDGLETVQAIRAARSAASSPRRADDKAIQALGEGWVGEEALAIALYAVLVAKDFKEALRVSANHDGDSDSTASIAGQLWGAAYGFEGMPADWAKRLDVRHLIDELLKQWSEQGTGS